MEIESITYAGDEETLQAYMREHKDELERTAREMRQAAATRKAQLASAEMPYTNAEWLAWLREGENGKAFRDL